MKKYLFVATILLSIVNCFNLHSKEFDKTITLGVTIPVLNSSRGQFCASLYKEVFSRLNYNLEIKTFPPLRLAERTKSENIDGELIRMSKYGVDKPFLTKVEESSFDFNLAAYSSKKHLTIEGWNSFKGMHIVYRRGMKIIEKELVGKYDDKFLHSFPDPSSAIKLLAAKRVDVLIGVEYFMNEVLSISPTQYDSIKKIKRLKSDSAHVFLGKKYSHLASKISKESEKMKKSGEYKRLMTKH